MLALFLYILKAYGQFFLKNSFSSPRRALIFRDLQKCKTRPLKCKMSEWKNIPAFCYYKYAKGNFVHAKQEEENVKEQSKKISGRLIGWLMIIFLIVVIVPVGAVMFVISGTWSALDRALLKFNR